MIALPALHTTCVSNQILETGSWGSCETGVKQDKTAIVTVICLDLSFLPVWEHLLPGKQNRLDKLSCVVSKVSEDGNLGTSV